MSTPTRMPPVPPRPSKAPQWVGDGDSRRDVANFTDRGIAVMALDAVLRVQASLKVHCDDFLRFRSEYVDDKATLLRVTADLEKRLACLEIDGTRGQLQSSHEWNEMLVNAGVDLSKHVKSGRLDSTRARKIAEEVYDSVKTANDAKMFRRLKSKTEVILWEIAKALVMAGVGFAASHWGLHGGRP